MGAAERDGGEHSLRQFTTLRVMSSAEKVSVTVGDTEVRR